MFLTFKIFRNGAEIPESYGPKPQRYYSTVVDGAMIAIHYIDGDLSYIPIDEIRSFDDAGRPVNTYRIKIENDKGRLHVRNGSGLTVTFIMHNHDEVIAHERSQAQIDALRNDLASIRQTESEPDESEPDDGAPQR
jgi:hypothetical protein